METGANIRYSLYIMR